jgi:hypothetical protein
MCRTLIVQGRRSLLPYLVAASVLVVVPASTSRGELVGYWPFDDMLDDLSGQGNNGTLIGEPIFSDDVPPLLGAGKSLLFDGDDAVDFGNPNILNFGSNDWTISAWAKKVAGSARGNIYSNGGDNGGGIRSVLAIGETGGDQAVVLTTDVDQGDGAKQQAVSTADEIANIPSVDDEWNHVVGMRAGDEIRVYVNGELADTTELRTDPPYDLSGMAQLPVYVGVGASAASDPIGALEKWFTGNIDDVAVWDEALEDGFIAYLAEGGSILGPPGLPGDFNQDGAVDQADFLIMSENFNQRFDVQEAYFRGDFDLNTRVDLRDFVQFREVFLAEPAGAAAPVPEPSTLLLLACGWLAALWRGRKR